MDMASQIEAIRRSIAEAFADVEMPPADQVADGASPDERCAVRNFGGKHREDIGAIRSAWTEDLCYMKAGAILYYLPLFLDSLLLPENFPDFDLFGGMIVFFDLASSGRGTIQWPVLSPQQRTAILAWVDFLKQHIKSYENGRMREEYMPKLQRIRKWLSAG
jgi:hypothetical protein